MAWVSRSDANPAPASVELPSQGFPPSRLAVPQGIHAAQSSEMAERQLGLQLARQSREELV